MSSMLLSLQNVELLESYLFSDALENSAMDYFELVGAVTAQLVSPAEITDAEFIELITGTDNPPTPPSFFLSLINELRTKIKTEIEQEESLIIPTEAESELDCIRNWCSGFCQVYFCTEEKWFEKDEELVGELMLPILALSGLLDEDESFIDIKDNLELLEAFCDQLPDLVLDLYLLFHSE